MQATLNIALEAARKAVACLQAHARQRAALVVEHKGLNEFVSQADHEAEQIIVEHLQRHCPQHAILAEESGHHAGGEGLWIIDPLDGTTNFLHGVPQYAVSIALEMDGQAQLAVVADVEREEYFTAIRGQGAWLGGKPIRVSAQPVLEGALLATGTPYRDASIIDPYAGWMTALIRANTAGIRRPGAAALDLAWLACGRFDAFFEYGLARWDVAAGALLIEEAGGKISGLDGHPARFPPGDIIASNGPLHPAMLTVAQPFQRQP